MSGSPLKDVSRKQTSIEMKDTMKSIKVREVPITSGDKIEEDVKKESVESPEIYHRSIKGLRDARKVTMKSPLKHDELSETCFCDKCKLDAE
jgi:hypothetical protein